MLSVILQRTVVQPRVQRRAWICAAGLAVVVVDAALCTADRPVLPVAGSEAKTQGEMKPYTDQIVGTEVKFDMVPISGGSYMMGSPEREEHRKPDEGPQHEIKIEPFWMGKHEVTWDEYEVFMFTLDIQRRQVNKVPPTEMDKLADAVSRPTKPYTDMSFGMGREGFPAISMTHLAARVYCQWLSAKTGRYYRLPTEAEWEYACRAGTTTAYHFGDNADELDQYGWFYDNSDDAYHEVGQKKQNPWGLYDMHGNVAEWVLDQYDPQFYKQFGGKTTLNPVNPPLTPYPHIVRGGSWDDDSQALRSAARRASSIEWKQQDPQIPQSIWYETDAQFVGFRIVRPLVEPTQAEKQKLWDINSEAKNTR